MDESCKYFDRAYEKLKGLNPVALQWLYLSIVNFTNLDDVELTMMKSENHYWALGFLISDEMTVLRSNYCGHAEKCQYLIVTEMSNVSE